MYAPLEDIIPFQGYGGYRPHYGVVLGLFWVMVTMKSTLFNKEIGSICGLDPVITTFGPPETS